MGPVISGVSKTLIEAHIADAISKGAKDVTPTAENPSFAHRPSKGHYIPPTVLTNVNHSMRVMCEETFGPVIPIMKVSDDDEAVRVMNDSEYGLTASVWTRDIQRAEELIEQIDVGTVFVNRCDYPSPVSFDLAVFLLIIVVFARVCVCVCVCARANNLGRILLGLDGKTPDLDARLDRMHSMPLFDLKASISRRSSFRRFRDMGFTCLAISMLFIYSV